MDSAGSLLALDVGERRIGVALANPIAKIASPLTTLINDVEVFSRLQELLEQHNVNTIVVGLPRGLDGQETGQTKSVRSFASVMEQKLAITPVFQDEALSSVASEEKLKQSHKTFKKEDIDMYAAAYILQDYLDNSSVREQV